jgi:hypothetical protein
VLLTSLKAQSDRKCLVCFRLSRHSDAPVLYGPAVSVRDARIAHKFDYKPTIPNDLMYIYTRMETNFYQPLLATLVVLLVWHLFAHLTIEFVRPALDFNQGSDSDLSLSNRFDRHPESICSRIWSILQLHFFYIVRVVLAQSTVPVDKRFFRWTEPALHMFMFFINIYYTYFIKTDKVSVTKLKVNFDLLVRTPV